MNTTHTLSSDGAAAISSTTYWRKIDAHTPLGVKMQLINKAAGIAATGLHTGRDTFYTHWHPLPVFSTTED